MHQQIKDALRRPLALALAASAVSALALSACGGSSGKAATATSANAAATSTTTGSGGASATTNTTTSSGGASAGGASGKSGATGAAGARQRFGGVRECLQRNGIKFPSGATGQRGLFLGGASLPKGVSRAQLQATMRKCLGGHGFFANRGGAGAFRRAANPRLRQALSAFAACLRKNGIAVPAPNTSGNGPVFSTKGLNTTSPKFKAATAKCRSQLIGVFGGRGPRPGAGVPPPPPTG